MVFSINSRYALQRVSWIPPTSYIFTCLKATDKTLSTKGPKEDISKPPLRLNIPKDCPYAEPYSKFIKSAQPRSKSLISKSKKSFTPGAEDGLLCKSGSEMHFSSFRKKDDLESNEFKQDTPSQTPGLEYSEQNPEQNYYQTVHNFYASKEDSESKKESENNAGEQSLSEMFPGKENAKVENNAADSDETKNLYIVIDGPGREVEKQFAHVNTCEPVKREFKFSLPSFIQDDFEAVKSMCDNPLQPRSASMRMAKKKFEGPKGKTSQTKLPSPKGEKDKICPKVKFQVHEIDDTSTYVFQLKFKKGLQGRTCAVGCVPEKEVNTRRMDPDTPFNYYSGPESRSRPLKEVTYGDDQLEYVKHPDRKARGKNKKENADVEKYNKEKTNTINAVKSYQNPSGLESMHKDGSDEVTGSVSGQSAVEGSYSQNYEVSDQRQTQAEIPSSAHDSVTFQTQAPEIVSEKTAETVSSSAVEEESAVNQNSKMLQTSHETDKVDTANKTAQSQASDYPQAQYSEPQHQETQPDSEAVSQNPTTNVDTAVSERSVKNKTERFRKLENKNRSVRKTLSGVNSEACEPESSDFQTTKNVVRIQSERPPTPPKYSAGLPKFINKSFKNQRKGFGIIERDSMFGRKWSHKSDFDAEKGPSEIFKNPLFFSTKETGEMNPSLFKKKDDILHVYKGTPKEDGPKITDNMVNVANENLAEDKGKASVDSLAMMKQLKEIVDFDLKNAVKIFEGRKAQEKVHEKAGDQKQEESGEKIEAKSEFPTSQNQDAIERMEVEKPEVEFDGSEGAAEINHESVVTPKLLPGKRRNRNSVVDFDAETEKFAINKKELERAVSRRRENFGETYLKTVCQELSKILSNEMHVVDDTSPIRFEFKSGDSILVFDETTQTWKVDFSILEKRKQQMREEEELTRRSEMILETFEKLEQGKVSNIPRPSSREKKTFDYNKEEWTVYHDSDKAPSGQKSGKSKLPFKESDAEEIRKRNSDLYDDLFIANKKDADMTQEVKDVSDTSEPKKTAKSFDGKRGTKKMASVSNKPEEPCEGDKIETPSKEDKKEVKQAMKASSKNSNKGEKEEKKEAACKESGEGNKKEPPKDPCKGDHKPKSENSEIDEEGWGAYIKEEIPPLSSVPKSSPAPPAGKTTTVPPNTKKINPARLPPLAPDIDKISPNKITPPAKTGVKIDEPRFRIPLPFGRRRKIEEPKKKPSKTEKGKSKGVDIKVPPNPAKPEGDSKIKTSPSVIPDPKTTPTKEPPKVPDPKSKPPTPPTATPKGADPKSKPPPPFSPLSPKTADPVTPKSASGPSSKLMDDPKSQIPTSATINKEHYVSDNIVEMSKYVNKDKNATNKSKQFETVKLNITSDTRTPSKITEINLNKKVEEKTKETSAEPKNMTGEKCSIENKTFYRNFEKYKTPFSDPEFEEKSVKINSDMETNPNLKKLDNWNKTLVLHDTMKPSENVESWLKDETDKMATLLLKVLQEAADGKPKRKAFPPKTKQADKTTGKGNPYDNIRKKQENTPEGFLFKVRTVNFALGGDINTKSTQQSKSEKKTDQDNNKEIPVQSSKTAKSTNVVEVLKMPEVAVSETSTGSQLPSLKKGNKPSRAYSDIILREPKAKYLDIALDDMNSPWVGKDVETKLSVDLSDDIPGPEILKKISGTWKMFPVLGCQATIFTLLRIFQLVNLGTSFWNSSVTSKPGKNAFSKLFTKYGPIVNLQGPLSGNIVLMHKPEHLTGIFEQDIGCSVRSVFDSLEQSRREAENKILTVGISTDWSKMEWNELKKASNDPLVRGCEKFFRPVEIAGESLISNIRRNRNNQNLVSDDFMKEIKQWSLEGLCTVLFEKSFGFLEGRNNNTSWLLEPEKFFSVIEEATEYLSKCERGFQAWRLMSTPSSVSLNQAYRSLYTILSKQLYQAELNLKNKNELLKDNSFIGSHDLTFLESMLLNDKMTVEDIICNVVDFLLIGVNTMSSALGFMLYNLAQNVKVQGKLLKEVKEMLPDKTSRLDYHKLHSLKYLQACLKESLRLNSPVPVFFRVLQNDVMVSNYVIPKETFVVMDFKFSNTKEQIFEDPEKFLPERWLTDEKWLQDLNPLSSLPFCHGPRADLARRVVEMQLWSCIARIVRNFQIEYHYGEIQGTENVFAHPDKPLKLNFVERDE